MRTRTWPIGTLVVVVALAAPSAARALDMAGCVKSELHPISVCYESASDADKAAFTLSELDGLWTLLVDGVGFSSPWRLAEDEVTPEVGVEAFVLDLGGQAAGYAEGVADLPDTPHADCAVRLWIERAMPSGYLPSLLGHEFAHAVHMADDCAEPLPHAIVPYLELVYLRDAGHSMGEYLTSETSGLFYYQTFQANPHLPLDHFAYSDPNVAYFNYGHGLFTMFLDERYGAGDGTLIRDISFAARQEGTIGFGYTGAFLVEGENEPDLYDAIDVVLQLQGESFWSAVGEFSIWRVLTGMRDDGHHLRHAGWLPAAAIDMTLTVADLPVTDQAPAPAPSETGTTYLSLTLPQTADAQSPHSYVFELASEGGGAWHVAAIQWHADAEASVTTTELGGRAGSFSIDVVPGARELIVAVTSLGDRDHDLDAREWDPTPFTFGLQELPPPTITNIEPFELEVGALDVPFSITGTGFEPDGTVSFGDGTTVGALDVTATAITGTVSVADDAVAGRRDVAVTCADGREARWADYLWIIAPPKPIVTGLSPDRGRVGESLTVRVRGQHLAVGVTLALSGDGVVIGKIEREDITTFTAAVTLEASATPGLRDVTVANPDGEAITLTAAFEVLPGEEVPDTPGADVSSPGGDTTAAGPDAGGGPGGESDGGGTSCTTASVGTRGMASASVLVLLGMVVVSFALGRGRSRRSDEKGEREERADA